MVLLTPQYGYSRFDEPVKFTYGKKGYLDRKFRYKVLGMNALRANGIPPCPLPEKDHEVSFWYSVSDGTVHAVDATGKWLYEYIDDMIVGITQDEVGWRVINR